jgi:alanyl-tRNA synthetase
MIKMKKLSSYEIREMFLNFFEEKDHTIIESASLIPVNDPSLLWINSGIAPLKKYFDGSEVPSNRRIATCQKCIRTNDIDNVGETAIHHTFFEMLGNFSIGDYFKKEALEYSYEFLTSDKYLGFPKEKLYMTVYPSDVETYNIWLSLGIDESHIIKLENNYWEIGEGPCGPDSEIFYDRGEEYDLDNIGIDLLIKEIDNDRYVEIWNNVFSQYNAKEGLSRDEYPELPSKNIDTGMGFERICAIIQNGKTNYDTDLFLPTIKEIELLSKVEYKGDKPFKVISDHVRAVTFALADGAFFSNEGRGYVLRRLIRRAVRYGKKLNINKPFLYKLVSQVVISMKNGYPYLVEKERSISELILNEENLFHATLESGEKRLHELFTNSENNKISGEDAFKLYDTYGFPFELTLEYAEEKGFTVLKEEFDEFMKEQKERARQARGNNKMNTQNEQLLKFVEESTFTGYDSYEEETTVIGLIKDDEVVPQLSSDGSVILKETPFYAESGGQVADTGYIIGKEFKLKVIDVTKLPNKQHLHQVVLEEGIVNLNDQVKAVIDKERRESIMRNHSTAHLLHCTLNELLDNEVLQAGAKVDDKELRFDFTYNGKINEKQILELERFINEKVKVDFEVTTEIMSIEEARTTKAMFLFDDKYDKMVRVVTILDSMELCGGTHINNVNDIKQFAVTHFEPRGTNIYRIAASTNSNISNQLKEAVKPYKEEFNKLLKKGNLIINQAKEENINLELKIKLEEKELKSYKDVIAYRFAMEELKDEIKNIAKAYNKQKQQKLLTNMDVFEQYIEELNNLRVIIIKIDGYDTKIFKQLIDNLFEK